MIIKIYNKAGVQVSEMPYSALQEEGWSVSEFMDLQSMMDRTCKIVDALTGQETNAPANE